MSGNQNLKKVTTEIQFKPLFDIDIIEEKTEVVMWAKFFNWFFSMFKFY